MLQLAVGIATASGFAGAAYMANRIRTGTRSRVNEGVTACVNGVRTPRQAVMLIKKLSHDIETRKNSVCTDDLLTELVNAFQDDPISECTLPRLHTLLEQTDFKGEAAFALTLLYSACLKAT
jgi:hypothetical protein